MTQGHWRPPSDLAWRQDDPAPTQSLERSLSPWGRASEAATRRTIIGGLAALVSAPALARFPDQVPDGLAFFVGNSFTRQHAIPSLVCRIAAATGTTARCHPHTANGAWLDASMDFAKSLLAERGSPLPATVVLQDHSIAPLTPRGRHRSARAIAAWSAAFRHTVLFETWPRRADHPIYTRRNRPPTPEYMAEIVHDHYRQQAHSLVAAIAPVGLAWLAAETENIALHAADGYHANLAGAWLAAMMLARALDFPDPYGAAPPPGVDRATATLLAGIAARHAYQP